MPAPLPTLPIRATSDFKQTSQRSQVKGSLITFSITIAAVCLGQLPTTTFTAFQLLSLLTNE